LGLSLRAEGVAITVVGMFVEIASSLTLLAMTKRLTLLAMAENGNCIAQRAYRRILR